MQTLSFLSLTVTALCSLAIAIPISQYEIPADNENEMFNGVLVVRVTRATPVLPPGVTDDTPDFDRGMVMLDISDKLFGASASRVIDASKIIGSWMMNTARRFAALVQYFKPFFAKALNVKGLYPPPPTAEPTRMTTTTTESN
ncbi:uncharacterized protein LOC129565822 [Sitodiplosis mosellana]|uniref:uncharacterized protein LOC129565822 n=1 Tax=Sitodiplosis mosellana TaxID=263140 RepID=UPI002444A149|nr:uncharacterized protein LOC129565822 [Sitodiplosis mosellana]